MQTIRVHDKSFVLILNKTEVKALDKRLRQNTGFRKTKPLLKVEEKLLAELEYQAARR